MAQNWCWLKLFRGQVFILKLFRGQVFILHVIPKSVKNEDLTPIFYYLFLPKFRVTKVAQTYPPQSRVFSLKGVRAKTFF